MYYHSTEHSGPKPLDAPEYDGVFCSRDCPCLRIKPTNFETIRVCSKYNTSLALYKCPVIPRCGQCWNEYGE